MKSTIAEFVSSNKLPLVTTFTRESASVIFESPIKKQVMWNGVFEYEITRDLAMSSLEDVREMNFCLKQPTNSLTIPGRLRAK